MILRPNGTSVKRVSFNYNKAVAQEAQPEALFLQLGDVVVVP